MKYFIKIFGSLLLVFILFSCGKDADPILEIYISAKKSDLYQNITMEHGKIEMITGESGGPYIDNYNGLDVNLDLTSDNNIILAGEVRFSAGIYSGLHAHLQKIEVFRIEGSKLQHLFYITDSNKKFGGEFELVNNTRYRIDFIYDVDKSITLLDPEYDFDTVVEIKITQL